MPEKEFTDERHDNIVSDGCVFFSAKNRDTAPLTKGVGDEGKSFREAYLRQMQSHQAQRYRQDHLRESETQTEAGLSELVML